MISTEGMAGFIMGCGAAADAAWGLWSLGVPAMLVILAIGLCVPPPAAR